LEHSNCKSFESWGFTDKYGFLPAGQNPLPFDVNMQPKEAHERMYQKLLSFPRDDPAVLERTGVTTAQSFLQ